MGDGEIIEPDRPAWWNENAKLRHQLSLPPYEPSRFSDGTYTFKVVSALETVFDCSIQFIGVNPTYPDDWEVRIDGERLLTIGRHRDEHGNTVYEMDADTFKARVRANRAD